MGFPAINVAANAAISYLKIGAISSHLQKLAGEVNLAYLDRRLQNDIDSLEYLEAEIKQFWHGAKRSLQTEYFEYLRYALEAFDSWNTQPVQELVEQENEKINEDFKIEVEKKDKAFREDPNYQMEHGQEYEVEIKDFGLFGGVRFSPYKKKYIYSKFYCLENGPAFLDTNLIPDYIKIAGKVTSKFKQIANYYIGLWDAGKITSDPDMLLLTSLPQPKQPLLSQLEKETEPIRETKTKLKFNLSGEQIACLFRLLSEVEAFKGVQPQTIFEFIETNVVTNRTENTGLSANTIKNDFYTVQQKTLDFWSNKFAEMNKAGKNLK